MTKRILIPIIGITTLLITMIGWQVSTYSKSPLPYPDPPTGDNPSQCLQSIANELVTMRNAWNVSKDLLKKQQKPASQKVDEALESMRTYRCWLDYLCQGVLFSGTANFVEMKDLESKGVPFGAYLGTMPGCVSGDKVVIPGTKLKFLPYCNVPYPVIDRISQAETYYRDCRNLVALEFTDPAVETDTYQLPSDVINKIRNESSGMVAMESFLKNDSGEQKGMILQNKLQSILLKMQGLESHVDLLREYMERFDAKLSCVAPKCD